MVFALLKVLERNLIGKAPFPPTIIFTSIAKVGKTWISTSAYILYGQNLSFVQVLFRYLAREGGGENRRETRRKLNLPNGVWKCIDRESQKPLRIYDRFFWRKLPLLSKLSKKNNPFFALKTMDTAVVKRKGRKINQEKKSFLDVLITCQNKPCQSCLSAFRQPYPNCLV